MNYCYGLDGGRVRGSIVLAAAAAALAGCAGERVLRENVLATTQSTAGLSLAQNPQTHLYEARLGYARSELFLVPTSKRVVGGAGGVDAAGLSDGSTLGIESSDPASTPEVIAEIRVDGRGVSSAGLPTARGGVYQRLAVGREAVRSSAALALLAPDAQTAEVAASIHRPAAAPSAERAHRLTRVRAARDLAAQALQSQGVLLVPEAWRLDEPDLPASIVTTGELEATAARRATRGELPFSGVLTRGSEAELEALERALIALSGRGAEAWPAIAAPAEGSAPGRGGAAVGGEGEHH